MSPVHLDQTALTVSNPSYYTRPTHHNAVQIRNAYVEAQARQARERMMQAVSQHRMPLISSLTPTHTAHMASKQVDCQSQAEPAPLSAREDRSDSKGQDHPHETVQGKAVRLPPSSPYV